MTGVDARRPSRLLSASVEAWENCEDQCLQVVLPSLPAQGSPIEGYMRAYEVVLTCPPILVYGG